MMFVFFLMVSCLCFCKFFYFGFNFAGCCLALSVMVTRLGWYSDCSCRWALGRWRLLLFLQKKVEKSKNRLYFGCLILVSWHNFHESHLG